MIAQTKEKTVIDVFNTLSPQQRDALETVIHFKNNYPKEEYEIVRGILFKDMELTYDQFIVCEYLVYIN